MLALAQSIQQQQVLARLRRQHHRPRRRAPPAATATAGARQPRRQPPCPPSPPSLHQARDALAGRLLDALASDDHDEDDDEALAERVKGLVLEAADALRASRDWPLLVAALEEGREDAAAPPPPERGASSSSSLFLAAGLGSLGQYRARLRELPAAAPGGLATTSAARRRACPRAGMRLFQLAVARLLLLEEQQQGAAAAATTIAAVACDPEYDPLDLALLRSLGFSAALRATVGEALRSSASSAGAAEAEAAPSLPPPPNLFCYMPLCPRDAYDEVLAAYWCAEALPGLRVLGTSFGAQGESAALVAAIAAFGGGGGGHGAPVGRRQLRLEPPSERQALLAAAAPDGVMVEIPAPDFACHGVGVALHAFGRGGGDAAAALGAFFAGEGARAAATAVDQQQQKQQPQV